MDAIAHATQALQVLLDRADRPRLARKAAFALDPQTASALRKGDTAGTESQPS